jgi:hypothetical protein
MSDEAGGNGGTEGGAGGNAGADEWFAGLDEPVRDLIAVKGFDKEGGPANLAKSYFELNRYYKGATDVVALPSGPEDAEGHLKVFTALGRPSKASAYEHGLGEDAKVDPEFFGAMTGKFHEANLTREQAKAVIRGYQEFSDGFVKKQQAAGAEKEAAEEAELKKAFGEDLDAKMESGRRAIKGLGIEQGLVDRIENAAGSSAIKQLFAVLGEKIGVEDRVEGGKGESFTTSPEAARVEVAALKQDKDFIQSLRDAADPSHKANKERWERLFRIMAQKS